MSLICQPTSEDIKQRNRTEGAHSVRGQLRGGKECPFSGVTDSGRVWRKVPEGDARSVKSVSARSFLPIVQELCESRGGRPELSVLTSLLVSVDVKNYSTVLRHWSQLVPNMSNNI